MNTDERAGRVVPADLELIRVHLCASVAENLFRLLMDLETINSITERVIGCAYKVASKLGCGFLEKNYENALAYELKKAGLMAAQQVPLKVWYDDIIVGEYFADLLVEGVVLVEVKAIQGLDPVHTAQCINYLAATKLPICLLINFGKRVDVKRIAGSALSSYSPSSASGGSTSVVNPPDMDE